MSHTQTPAHATAVVRSVKGFSLSMFIILGGPAWSEAITMVWIQVQVTLFVPIGRLVCTYEDRAWASIT